jgi:hypothetical protein
MRGRTWTMAKTPTKLHVTIEENVSGRSTTLQARRYAVSGFRKVSIPTRSRRALPGRCADRDPFQEAESAEASKKKQRQRRLRSAAIVKGPIRPSDRRLAGCFAIAAMMDIIKRRSDHVGGFWTVAMGPIGPGLSLGLRFASVLPCVVKLLVVTQFFQKFLYPWRGWVQANRKRASDCIINR